MTLPHTERAVLRKLHSAADGPAVTPEMILYDLSGYSRSSVLAALRRLQADGLVTYEHRCWRITPAGTAVYERASERAAR